VLIGAGGTAYAVTRPPESEPTIHWMTNN
jgi:hypothetical protein